MVHFSVFNNEGTPGGEPSSHITDALSDKAGSNMISKRGLSQLSRRTPPSSLDRLKRLGSSAKYSTYHNHVVLYHFKQFAQI